MGGQDLASTMNSRHSGVEVAPDLRGREWHSLLSSQDKKTMKERGVESRQPSTTVRSTHVDFCSNGVVESASFS